MLNAMGALAAVLINDLGRRMAQRLPPDKSRSGRECVKWSNPRTRAANETLFAMTIVGLLADALAKRLGDD
jgi:hypothetical protein